MGDVSTVLPVHHHFTLSATRRLSGPLRVLSASNCCRALANSVDSLRRSVSFDHQMKPRHVSAHYSEGNCYPQIQLRGDWLRDIGYEPGQRIEVESQSGALVIRPVPDQQYGEADRNLASIVDGVYESVLRDFEVKLQLSCPPPAGRLKINGPDEVAKLLEPLQYRDREVFCSLYLDTRHCISGIEEVAVGTLSSALTHPREIYKGAMLSNAAGLIIAHNHPSGDVSPSAEDRKVTQRLADAGELIGIRLLDHIILGGGSYSSFRDKGWL